MLYFLVNQLFFYSHVDLLTRGGIRVVVITCLFTVCGVFVISFLVSRPVFCVPRTKRNVDD